MSQVAPPLSNRQNVYWYAFGFGSLFSIIAGSRLSYFLFRISGRYAPEPIILALILIFLFKGAPVQKQFQSIVVSRAR